jgi:hypothetical protein
MFMTVQYSLLLAIRAVIGSHLFSYLSDIEFKVHVMDGKRRAVDGSQTPPVVEEETKVLERIKFGRESQPRVTLLARTCRI